MGEHTAAAFIARIVEVATAVGLQAEVGAEETAGHIVSCLHAAPEQLDRFMAEGSELFIDGTFDPEKGCLTYMTADGRVLSPTLLRSKIGVQQ